MSSKRPAGRAFVEIYADDSKLKRALKSALNSMSNFLQRIKKLALVGAAALAGLATAIYKIGETGAKADAIMRKFDGNFSNNNKSAHAFAKTLKNEVGASLYDIYAMMSDFKGEAFVLGLEGKEAEDMAKNLTRMVYDLSAAQNMPVPQAFSMIENLMSGGGPRQFKKLGVDMTTTNIEARKLALGLGDVADRKTDILAMLSIYEDWAKASGTVGQGKLQGGEALSTFRALKGTIKDLIYDVSLKFLPQINAIFARIVAFLEKIKNSDDFLGEVKGQLLSLGSLLWVAIKAAFVKVKDSLSTLIRDAVFKGVKDGSKAFSDAEIIAQGPKLFSKDDNKAYYDALKRQQNGESIEPTKEKGFLGNATGILNGLLPKLDGEQIEGQVIESIQSLLEKVGASYGDFETSTETIGQDVLGGFYASNSQLFSGQEVQTKEIVKQTNLLDGINKNTKTLANKPIGSGLKFA